ncbi:carbohydrate kinase family protein [Sedimentimonas flavescens]|uniref:carbohydrate kinase family protein n=1 Tax=Sedimentimonas flavescens TaxID=2851012 RepID=UPI001C49FF6F|nr:carbohydrate kinase [Sedimentimonas flavescens]MBW0158896.1 carbohydrate kinase [Sedimentimonas flavescens]
MILCCGEALIDMIPAHTAEGGNAFAPHSGGAVFNTAIALGRLGADVGMLTGLSTDLFGAQLASALAASGVDASQVIYSDRLTTLAFVQLREGHASYTFYDENSAGRMIAPEDLPSLPDRVDALFFGGISLACEPGAEAYAALLEREGATRAVMIDPNIRPGFIRDEAAFRARLDRMFARADIVKVSDEDLHWLIPGPGGLAEKAVLLQAHGPALVLVTRGGEGAMAWTADGTEVSIAANKVAVVDTVGAGDTFNAGVLDRLASFGLLSKAGVRGVGPEALRTALAFGARVAGITVSRAGANPPWREEL